MPPLARIAMIALQEYEILKCSTMPAFWVRASASEEHPVSVPGIFFDNSVIVFSVPSA